MGRGKAPRVPTNFVSSAITIIRSLLDEDVTCTITNTADAPTLTLVKVVDNGATGATSVANDWDLTATGDGGFTETTPAAADATATAVKAGVAYALSDTARLRATVLESQADFCTV